MSERPDLKTSLRAGGALFSALATRTGALASPRRGLLRPLLLAGLVAGGAVAAYAAVGQAAAPSASDRAAIEAVVHDYILAHPEIIPQAMQRLRENQLTQAVEENRSALETPYRGAWEGAAQPDVTLVTFMDYACGYCRASLPDIERLLRENPGLRVVYHELPIIAEGSLGAARVSLLAADTGHFKAFHTAMYAAGNVEPESVVRAATASGIDAARARAALESDSADETLMANVRLAQALQVQGTPLFVVGNQVLTGAVGYDQLKAAIAKARGAS